MSVFARRARMAAFAPNKIPGLGLWLKADAITGLSDATAVSSWADSSGFGRNATQATGGLQPLYKTAILNGKPVVRFDGTDDKLATAAFSSAFTQPNTVIIVCSVEQPTLTGGYICDGIVTGNRHALFVNGGAPYTRSMYGGTTIVGANDDLPMAAAVLTTFYNGASSATYKNGTLHVAGSAGTASLTGLSVGSRFNGVESLKGDIAEVLIYRKVLTTAEQQTLERDLGRKYAITVA